MYLDAVEGLYLKAAGYYKDIPNSSCKIYHISKLNRLLREGLIRQSKSGLSCRLTDKGYMALENNGYRYERDKFAVGLSDKLYRRLEISEFALMASDIADIFLSKPSDYNNGDIAFLPAFALRRDKMSRVLGNSKMLGFLYTEAYVFIPYYLSERNKGLYPHIEQMLFASEAISLNKAPIVIYTGQTDYSELFYQIHTELPKKARLSSFDKSINDFSCPVCLLPLSLNGAKQLNIMCQQNYRTKIAKAVLLNNYKASKYMWFDAMKNDEPVIISVDLDIKRIKEAISKAKAVLNIFVLDFQASALIDYIVSLYGRKKINIYSIDYEHVSSVLNIQNCIKMEEGGLLYVE